MQPRSPTHCQGGASRPPALSPTQGAGVSKARSRASLGCSSVSPLLTCLCFRAVESDGFCSSANKGGHRAEGQAVLRPSSLSRALSAPAHQGWHTGLGARPNPGAVPSFVVSQSLYILLLVNKKKKIS